MNVSSRMGKYAKPLIMGFIALIVVSFLVGFIGGVTGANFGMLPMLMGLFAGAFTVYIMLNLSGTQKELVGSGEDRTRALSFEAPAGQAVLVVFREGFVAKLAGMDFTLDGKPLVQLKSPRFTAVPLTPGVHEVTAAFSGLAGPQSKPGSTAFTAAAGQVIAVRATVGMGAVKNSVVLEVLNETPEALRQRLGNVQMIQASA